MCNKAQYMTSTSSLVRPAAEKRVVPGVDDMDLSLA